MSSIGMTHVKVGQTVAFAMPGVHNESDSPVTIVGAKLLNVPAAFKVVKYRWYSLKKTQGYITNAVIGANSDLDFSRYPSRAVGGRGIRVNAHRQSIYYPVVYLKLVKASPAHLDGCEYQYLDADQNEHSQELECSYSLKFNG